MMADVYDVGDLVELRGLFRNSETWAPIDPTAVFLEVRDPAGILTTHQYKVGAFITRHDVGDYRARQSITIAGEWYYRFYSTGAGQAAEKSSLSVRPGI